MLGKHKIWKETSNCKCNEMEIWVCIQNEAVIRGRWKGCFSDALLVTKKKGGRALGSEASPSTFVASFHSQLHLHQQPPDPSKTSADFSTQLQQDQHWLLHLTRGPCSIQILWMSHHAASKFPPFPVLLPWGLALPPSLLLLVFCWPLLLLKEGGGGANQRSKFISQPWNVIMDRS